MNTKTTQKINRLIKHLRRLPDEPDELYTAEKENLLYSLEQFAHQIKRREQETEAELVSQNISNSRGYAKIEGDAWGRPEHCPVCRRKGRVSCRCFTMGDSCRKADGVPGRNDHVWYFCKKCKHTSWAPLPMKKIQHICDYISCNNPNCENFQARISMDNFK